MKYSEDIIIEPIVTEKSNTLKETNKYTFRVDARANKLQVIRAIESVFEVKPINCRIINVKGKPKRVRYKKGYTSQWKKAIVTLASGQTIQSFEGA